MRRLAFGDASKTGTFEMTENTETSDQTLKAAFMTLSRELALDDAAPTPLDRHRPTTGHRMRFVAAAAAVAACVLAAVAVVRSSNDSISDSPRAGVSDSRFEQIACAKQIVVGKTVKVIAGSTEGRLTVTFRVDEWIKPAEGPQTLKFVDIPDPRIDGEFPAWDLDLRRLLYVPRSDDEIVAQVTDQYTDPEPIIALVKEELPQGIKTSCPLSPDQ